MDYFTVDGVILRTGYKDKRDWYLLPIREMLDNDADFLWKYYKGANNASIIVNVTMDDELFRVTIRNSNNKNIPVFSDLGPIFDFDMRYGSKQDVHTISSGMLGDAMKQILSLGYVLLHTSDDGTAFTDKQWGYPLIVRHNKKERKIFLNVDKAEQLGRVRIEKSSKEVTSTDTELEFMLPIIDEVRNNLDRKYIEHFCRKYSIFTTDITFKFRIIDDITRQIVSDQEIEDDDVNIKAELITALSTAPEKAILNIDVPALHPIASEKEWSNANSIHSYKPEEFISRIINVHNKDSTSVYNLLLTFREGSNIKKTPENEISVSKLLAEPDKDQRIEVLYRQLKGALDPPRELALPYTLNTKKRRDALVERIAKLYDIDREKEPSYKLIRGFYNDDIGVVQYPYAFEILAIPFNDPTSRETEFIGAVNYSVSPKPNNFGGNYIWSNRSGNTFHSYDILDILRNSGFHRFYGSKSRLSCIVVGNLITPRRDPQGYDKSSIDTQPFSETIVEAVNKMVTGIQTYRAAGYRFIEQDDYRTASWHGVSGKVSAKHLLRQFLIEQRGLPAI